MQEVEIFQNTLLQNVSLKKRYLFEKIESKDRLVAIKGARGAGKTTLLLQKVKEYIEKDINTIYATLDHIYFLDNTLLGFVTEFMQQGGTHLFLDEVHKYPMWSREIKLIYDQFPNLKTVFTSSSILEIYKGESDLSRRVVNHSLKEMSFREFLNFRYDKNFEKINLEVIIKDHKKISTHLKNEIGYPLKEFKDYLQFGSYPFFLENEQTYLNKLMQTINLILEVDLAAIENIAYEDIRKIKKLLLAIAQSVPFTPNISKLSNDLKISRNFLINAIKLLNKADLIVELFKPSKGIGTLTKPEKLYLNNTNLIYALDKNQAEIGTLRETFFVNQMKHLHQIHLAEKGDFIIDEQYTFEISGKNKKSSQIKGLENGFVVRDDVEIGGLNFIPLYLFGFMY